MKKSWPHTWPITLFLVLVALTACRNGERPTPTPFPATSTAAPTAATGDALPVALADLAGNPEAYEGAYIQLTGQYRRLPRLICRADPHPPPAAWGVAGSDYLAQVSGYDNQLRSLLPENLMITVAGTWRQWRGPVGCGKRATPMQLWYLEGQHILSPSPIARVTLTPTFVGADSDATVIAAASPGTPSPTALAPAEPEDATPVGLPTTTVPASATATMPAPSPAPPTPTLSGSPTATGDSGTGGAETATATVAGTGAPTSTPSTPAGPTPTDGAGNGTVVEVDEIEPGLLGFEQLGANEKHNWPLFIDTSGTITVSVAAEPAVDLVLAILDGAQTPVVEQNQAPAGQLETIAGQELDPNEEYFIQVYATDGAPTSYAMTVWGDDSVVLRARGILEYGANSADMIGPSEVNYWFFAGQEGDTVTITVTPSGNADMIFLLYLPDGTDVDDVYEGEHPGEPVTLSLTLPQTGVYTIQVEEWNFEPASFQISLTGN